MAVFRGITVEQLITELEKYNPKAQVTMLADGAIQPFSIVYGHNGDESFDGFVTPETCNQVSFYLEKLNSSEKLNKNGVG